MLSLQAKRSLAIGLRKLTRCLTGTSFRGCLRRPSMCIGEAVPIALQADRTCVHVYVLAQRGETDAQANENYPRCADLVHVGLHPSLVFLIACACACACDSIDARQDGSLPGSA